MTKCIFYELTDIIWEIGMEYKLAKQHRKTLLWKGDNASYEAIHQYLRLHYGKPNKCDNPECVYPRKNRSRQWVMAPKKFEWAKIRGRNYSRNREDYMMLCKSCHAKYDLKKYAHLRIG